MCHKGLSAHEGNKSSSSSFVVECMTLTYQGKVLSNSDFSIEKMKMICVPKC